MRAFVNGVEKNPNVSLFKEADGMLQVTLMNNDGSPIDITGDTVALEVQSSKTRGTAVKDLAGVITVATGGNFTVSVTPALMDFGPGVYYLFAHRTDTDGGGEKYYADGFVTLTVN